ncbi:MAG TPA: DUF4124 domain-containing protein [Candidatus Binatia bacterium]|jgi:hypothetical protein
MQKPPPQAELCRDLERIVERELRRAQMKVIRGGKQRLAIVALAMLLPVAVPAGAQMKQWTDENGVVHFGNDPRPARPAEPEQQTITVNCDVDQRVFDNLKKPQLDEPTFRATIAQALADLNRCRNEIEGAYLLADMKLQTQLITATTIEAISIRTARNVLPLKKLENMSVVRETFLNVETFVKKRYDQTVPAWMRDNRDWRALDKAFQP